MKAFPQKVFSWGQVYWPFGAAIIGRWGGGGVSLPSPSQAGCAWATEGGGPILDCSMDPCPWKGPVPLDNRQMGAFVKNMLAAIFVSGSGKKRHDILQNARTRRPIPACSLLPSPKVPINLASLTFSSSLSLSVRSKIKVLCHSPPPPPGKRR